MSFGQEPQKKTSMADLEHLLKEVYLDNLNIQLSDNIFFTDKLFKPYKPTFKDKWKKFWNHIPDFIGYIKDYKYEEWRYYERF